MLDEIDVNRIIEMAWEDRTPFEVIQSEFNLTHGELIEIMRNNLKTLSNLSRQNKTNMTKYPHRQDKQD